MKRPAFETCTLRLADGREIAYLLRYARRTTIGLSVDHRGLVVSAPKRASRRALEALLRDRADWLHDKLDSFRRHQAPPFNPTEGEALLFLGNTLTLRLLVGGLRSIPFLDDTVLIVRVPDPEDGAAVRRKLERWYRAEAHRCLFQWLLHYAPRMGLPPPDFSLSSARTRWGSCNARGEIRLNWRLIQAPLHQIEYVVVHELAHLRELNHSPRFWSVVAEHFPNYKTVRAELKATGQRYWRF